MLTACSTGATWRKERIMYMRKRWLIVLVSFLSCTSLALAGQVWHVDGQASGPPNDGLSWCTAFTDLQNALAVAIAVANREEVFKRRDATEYAPFAIPRHVFTGKKVRCVRVAAM